MQQQRGSGKTAVLVERIIQKILNDNIDIDKLLVVTFTNAAASEMRERVLDAIYKKLDEIPDDDNLQKQIVLLTKSNICTIHSFCLDVIKNNFFELNLPATFRIASEEEIELLRQEVIEEVFEELYETENQEFSKLIESYTGYRGDESVKDLVFSIYRMIQSMPFPQKWLKEKVELFNKEKYVGQDFCNSIWGKILIDNFKDEVFDCINNFKIQKKKLDKFDELSKYSLIIQNDIELLQGLYNCCNSWDEAFEYASSMKFKNWPIDRKVTIELKDEVKKVRDNLKKKISDLVEKTLLYNSEEAYSDIYLLYDNLVALKNLILKFDEAFKAKKKIKNVIDFSDIEHYALEILIKEDENGNYISTEVAKKYQSKFEEIAIDEYQDSNQIQEMILKSVSRGNNIFMVGDVKQSIYKFRNACPELFLDKYENYSLQGNENGLKIQLFKNFRSNKNILDITNAIFQNIMSKELGSINYTEEEFLNLGADYPEIENGVGKSELHIIDLKNEQDEDDICEYQDDETEENNSRELDKIEIEAKFVSKKITELINSQKKVKCKNGDYKKIEYRDIVILLRSTSNSAPIFERELIKNNIPVFSDSSSEYLDTMEIQVILNLLKVINNPLDDITLVSVMRSPIGGFSDNEILEIRLENRENNVYTNLINASFDNNHICSEKAKKFLSNIASWKKESEILSLAELIWKIYVDTGFFAYVGLMTNGVLRQANLKMLFERAKEYEKTSFNGLFNFINFTEKLRSSSGDMASAKVIGESENVVRIMSIHKSKGLEFPVVFLSCANKKINLQDIKTNILLHKDIGFGPQYVDYDRKIQYPTAAKQSIKIIGKDEAISEEMRILYVALTRAKEKLIITGTINDVKKDEEKKKDILNIYDSNQKYLNPIILRKYISYLDWIQLVYFSEKLENLLDVYIHQKNEMMIEKEIENSMREFYFEKKVDLERIDNIFLWEYEDKALIDIPIKTTVSQIKELNERNTKNKIGLEEIKAKFFANNNEITSAQKGTLLHLILQKLDFNEVYTKKELQEFINNLVLKRVISNEDVKNINLNKIENFLNSDICNRIRNAKKVEKEKAFCMNEKMSEYAMHEISIQGIIDLCFVDENDKLVILDYKTDFVDDENDLKNKYSIQLEIYKKALELAFNRKVDEVYIYSIYLNKLINL